MKQTTNDSVGLQRQKSESFVARLFVIFLFLAFVSSMLYVNSKAHGRVDFMLGIYGSVMVTYLLGKMILSFFYKPFQGTPPDVKVTVIVPSYNEKAEAAVSTVESLLKQTYPIHEIFFIDDGSQDLSAYHAIELLKEECKADQLHVHRYRDNRGKRHAQIYGFERATGDIIFTTDSDGYIYPNAVEEMLIPFNDEKTMAVTGHINARNRKDSWLTRLLDMRYDNAFRVERAAQSVTGNVLVCSGPISCYRRQVILDNLERYRNQTFLGEPVQFGDDRCLTNYAIERGKTVYQQMAVCLTDVPTTLRQFVKQQIRWNKSFFRESLLAFKLGLKKPKVLVWVVLEMLLWITFGIALFAGIILKAHTIGYVLLGYYGAYVCLSAYARNVYYILKRPWVFFLAPLYGMVHLGLLFPLRLYALLTLRVTGWGTR
ncbi:glycosyltransferase [Alicyclobacillus fastidiosus]|uniref:Hyaluronan synthase n=1 Tax=Alicyclobacillus fastidiosus TaxID=392011 RepID=A0ABV5AEZ3_9BACL|nr:glycosyltransferase [Alicyclobacillus fastidiosus]WEH09535.1 glycosyltransferase [Alicyclobacillus fastidiosus]